MENIQNKNIGKEKKLIAYGILGVCFISLILGLITPKITPKPVEDENSLISSIETPSEKIALLNIEGPISSDLKTNSWSNTLSTDEIINLLEKAQKDTKVKAVILRINSPGGTVAASQDIYDAVIRLRKVKPVIVSMADVAASGGYYIASAADRIVAQKGTMTGSIGVIFNFVDIADLSNKLGIGSNVIKSGQFKDSGSPYRKMTQNERELFQSSVNDAYGQFIEAITKGRIQRSDKYLAEKRELTVATLKKYADGRVFLGDKAYELGFIDKIGSQYDAGILANEIVSPKHKLDVVQYNQYSGLKSFIMGLDSKLSFPIKNIIPFSYSHNNRPLLMMEAE